MKGIYGSGNNSGNNNNNSNTSNSRGYAREANDSFFEDSYG